MMICFRLKVETIIIPFRLIPIFLCFNLVQSPKYSNGHEYAPITFFATFTGAKKSVGTWIKALEEKSIEAGVVTFILNLQGG